MRTAGIPTLQRDTFSHANILTNNSVRLLRSEEYPLWDNLVSSALDTTVYHDRRWLKIISQVFNRHECFVGYFDEGNLLAGIPLTYKHAFGFALATRHTLLQYNQPLFQPDLSSEDRHSILRSMLKFLESSFDVVSITTNSDDSSKMNSFWQMKDLVTHHIEITDDDIMYNRMDHDVRRHIQLARHAGLTFHNECDFHDLYRLVSASYDRHNLLPPICETESIALCESAFSSNIGQFYSLHDEYGNVISAAFILRYRVTCYGVLLGTDLKWMNVGATQYLLWEICCALSQEKTITRFDLCGGNLASIGRFFSSMSAKRVTYKVHEFYSHAWLKWLMHFNGYAYRYTRKPAKTFLRMGSRT